MGGEILKIIFESEYWNNPEYAIVPLTQKQEEELGDWLRENEDKRAVLNFVMGIIDRLRK